MGNDSRRIDLKIFNKEPLFRIGLFDDQEHIDFRVMGKFAVQNEEGVDLIKKVESDLKWRVKIKESKPGKERFFLVLYESFNKKNVQEKLKRAQKIDDSVTIRVLGGDIFLENQRINNNTRYVITYGSFPNEILARKSFRKFQPDFIPYVGTEWIKEPQGQLEIFDAEYDRSAEVNNVVRVVPYDINTKVKIYDVRSFNEILQKDNFNDLVFNGVIEFRFDVHGSLMGISEIPLENYMKRVIYSEIGTDLPLEFSKSLAIVCRSKAMARINHRNLDVPIDYWNNGQTLRYCGDDFDDENIDKAVELTRGQVIVAENAIRDTPFHLICGGHTENASGMFEDKEERFFNGKYDGHTVPGDFTSLMEEEMVKKWIHSRPDTWCNLKGRKLSESLEKVKKYFRWEFNYSRRELEELIRKKTGEDIGTLFEIIPLARGTSGRLTDVEVIGSLKNYRIRGQFNIRETLAYDLLPSSCFLVERELDDTGTPISFTFVGAGHGHGVGMCTTGAAVMAMETCTSQEILEHYFEACHIQSIYSTKAK